MFKTSGFILAVIFGVCFALSSCSLRSSDTEYGIKNLRNVEEIAKASRDNPEKLPPSVAVSVIADGAGAAANKLDPEKEIQPVATAPEIAANPQAKLAEIFKYINAGPQGGWWNWAAILGVGAIAAGYVGRFMGPPFNIAGMIIQGVASKALPDYNKYKTAAVGVISSVDISLEKYGSMLDAAPETKKELADKLGGDPVDIIRKMLKSTQIDLGVQNEVSGLLDVMKNEMTTENGVLKPTMQELDKMISKKI